MGNSKNNKQSEDPYRYVDAMPPGKKTSFARTSNIQALSPTYQSLSDAAKTTLTVCKLCRQYHTGKDPKTEKPRTINGDLLQFYFNRDLQIRYGLKNPNKVRKSMVELVSNGFIDVIEVGWTTKTKNIYKFDWKWQILDRGGKIELSANAKTFIQGRPKKKKK